MWDGVKSGQNRDGMGQGVGRSGQERGKICYCPSNRHPFPGPDLPVWVNAMKSLVQVLGDPQQLLGLAGKTPLQGAVVNVRALLHCHAEGLVELGCKFLH